jgi:hypothetical protein
MAVQSSHLGSLLDRRQCGVRSSRVEVITSTVNLVPKGGEVNGACG